MNILERSFGCRAADIRQEVALIIDHAGAEVITDWFAVAVLQRIAFARRTLVGRVRAGAITEGLAQLTDTQETLATIGG